MTMGATGPGYLADIPGELVVMAQEDVEFALKLLSQDSREEAIREAGVNLTDEQLSKLHTTLDQIASLSFQEALQALKDVGVAKLY